MTRAKSRLAAAVVFLLFLGVCFGVADRGRKMTIQIPALFNLEVDYLDEQIVEDPEE